ncbi:MAG: methyltransferase domain-containing protein [Candidatus Eisenbacteria bacterium]|uniref:Methyltransferase domain-containing protein n=1 Tax=Eiseniibacteriota bacterium TaxID=2212470 RepID=A0A956M2D8_UNCEI|nr:methyltransferase domain-containing protein [Candidatus Eisenbacteria bacterium]
MVYTRIARVAMISAMVVSTWALTAPPSLRAGDDSTDAGGVGAEADSATYRVPFAGIQPYRYIDEQAHRETWQMPETVVDSLRIRPGQRIADIGAGIGYFETLLARATGESGKVFAEEIEPDLVAHLGERAIAEGTPQVVPILGTPDDPSLPDSLDLIFLCNTYRYIDGRRSYFARLRDRLRPGGRLAIVEFKRFPIDTTEYRILPERVIAELTSAGYRLTDEHDFLPKQYFLEFQPTSSVQVFGSMRAMIHERPTTPAAFLADLPAGADLYGIGALHGLAGEITIVAGRIGLSHPQSDTEERTVFETSSDAEADLLVTARVPAWRAVVLDRPLGFADLDEEIPHLLASLGLEPEGRIPFLIEGPFDRVQWHVIDGRRIPEGVTSHQAHRDAAVLLEREHASGVLVGFWSTHDEGVFTHMGSKTHIHCALSDPVSAGHLEDVVLPIGTVVKFPAVRELSRD